MRIAVNTRFLLHGKLEGMGWFAHEILRRMVVNHPEHQFYFLFDRKHDPAFVFAGNVTPVELFPPARHPFLWMAWFEWAVPRALKRLNADVFISTDGYCSLRTRVPTLLFWHDASYLFEPGHIGFLTRQYYRFFVPRFLRRADHIITFSQSAANDLRQYFSVAAQKISISTGAARHEFVPLQPEEQKVVRERWSDAAPYFLFVGAIQPRKNVHTLIEAFDAFKSQHPSAFKLLLAGRWAWKTNAVRAVYERSAHRADILFLGHLNRSDVAQVIAAAHAMVYPSFYEGFGLPVLEAIQCGVPAITSNVSSLPEVAGAAGLLVAPDNKSALANAIQTLAFNQDVYNRLRAECGPQAAKFNWDNTARDVYEALAKAVAGTSGSMDDSAN